MIDLADKCGDAGALFPDIVELATFFATSAAGVSEDLELLRHSGTIAGHIGLESDAARRHAGAPA
jgi:hypothetical protein